MRKLIKSIAVATMVAVAFPSVVLAEPASDTIALVVNDTILAELDAPPVIYNDFTLVPARDVFESLGADVNWMPPTQEIVVTYEDSIVSMQIDSRYANVSGRTIEMQIPPKIINERTMIPLRFVSESFGFDVQWNPQLREARITNNGSDVVYAGIVPPGINIPPSLLPGYISDTEENHDSQYYSANGDGDTNGNVSGDETTPRDISPFPIPEQHHPVTRLISVDEPSSIFLDKVSYGITAAGPISRVDALFLYGHRIVLDIHNAGSDLPSVTQMTSPFIKQVRASTADAAPAGGTRIVFDLHGSFDVGVTISEDRHSVHLSFSQSSVTDIGMTTDGTTDIITIDLNDIPRPNTSFLTNPRRFIVDLPGTSMDRLVDDAQSCGFVSHLQSTQHSPTAGRVVLSFSQAASVQTEVVGNSVVLTVTAPTYRNISYNHQTRTITISKAGMQINPSAITRQDEYHHLRYTLRMGYNLADHLGHGNFHINDDFIDYVNISTDTAGQTSLVISQRRVLAYTVTESAENIYIQARLPREIYSHIVVLDPGHGGSDNGAMRDGITEKYLNLVISQMLADIARQSGYIKVYTTRNDDTFVSLAERARFANEVGDLFVSIHHNAVRLGGNTAANGYETHYWTRPSADPHAITSHQAAHIMHRNVLNATGSNDREVRQSQFVVLTQTNIPAIFLEIGFMSNPAELQRMTDPVHQQRTAEGIYAGLREIFSVYAPRR